VRKLLVLALTTGAVVLASAGAAATTTPPAATPPAAAPAATPAASLSFPRREVVSGARPRLRYTTSNLPPGSRLFLQLRYGTPPAWTYVQTLKAPAGAVTLPGLPAGLYLFRINVLDGVTTVTTTPGRYLTVVPAAASSGCGICQFFGGIGGAVVSWLLEKVPWLLGKLPW
jgi:hypothetical protein